jgi:polar amino acid transport system ATP-binding protein
VPILQICNVSKTLGGRRVLDGISFALEKGQSCAIIGPSGEGKTTLLKCLNLLVAIDAGEIFLDGALVVRVEEGGRLPYPSMDPVRLRQRIGMVFQEWNLWPNMTVRKNITLALRHVRGLRRREAEQVAEAVCEKVHLREKLDVYPYSLSGGEKQRAAIARALAMDPEILMLDEVTSALDPVLAAEVLQTMLELKQDGRTLVVVTHHIDFARKIADEVLFLHGGRVHEAGPPIVLQQPQTNELASFLRQVRQVH